MKNHSTIPECFQQPERAGKILKFPIRYNFAENARYAVVRLCRGEPFLCGAELYGFFYPALAELAQVILQTRGRP